MRKRKVTVRGQPQTPQWVLVGDHMVGLSFRSLNGSIGDTGFVANSARPYGQALAAVAGLRARGKPDALAPRAGACGWASGVNRSFRAKDHDARTASKHLTPFQFEPFTSGSKRNGVRCFRNRTPPSVDATASCTYGIEVARGRFRINRMLLFFASKPQDTSILATAHGSCGVISRFGATVLG